MIFSLIKKSFLINFHYLGPLINDVPSIRVDLLRKSNLTCVRLYDVEPGTCDWNSALPYLNESTSSHVRLVSRLFCLILKILSKSFFIPIYASFKLDLDVIGFYYGLQMFDRIGRWNGSADHARSLLNGMFYDFS